MSNFVAKCKSLLAVSKKHLYLSALINYSIATSVNGKSPEL